MDLKKLRQQNEQLKKEVIDQMEERRLKKENRELTKKKYMTPMVEETLTFMGNGLSFIGSELFGFDKKKKKKR